MAQAYFDLRKQISKQTLFTADRAARIINSTFPEYTSDKHRNQVAVPLPYREIPTYVLPNNKIQPWALLPIKAAAYDEYSNFFRSSSSFFGSLNGSILSRSPFTKIPVDKLGLDLARICTNLGVLSGWDLVQRRDLLKDSDFVWPANELPRDHYDMRLFKHMSIRLAVKWEQYKPLWEEGEMVKEQREYREAKANEQQLASPEDEVKDTLKSSSNSNDENSGAQSVSSATSSSDKLANEAIPHLPLAPLFGSLPMSVKNISKASQPVLLYPLQLKERMQNLPSGIMLMYHPEVGIITDSQAFLFDVPAIGMAHLGLPISVTAAINGSINRFYRKELADGKKLTEVTKLKDWSLAKIITEQVQERNMQLIKRAREAKKQSTKIADRIKSSVEAMRKEVDKEDTSMNLEDELLAWQYKESGALKLGRSNEPTIPLRVRGGGKGGKK